MIRLTYILYLATNTKNGKIYIGQTFQTLKERVSDHINDSLSGRKKCYFNLAIKKHGPESFIWKEIDRCFTEKCADALETHYIKYYRSSEREIGYNLAKGGRVNRGFKKTQEQNIANSERVKELYATGKLIPWRKGKKIPASEKICKKVICIETEKIYRSIADAAKENNLSRISLSRATKNQNKTCGKLHWAILTSDFDIEAFRQNLGPISKNYPREILCISTNEKFLSITEAANYYKLRPTSISNVLSGHRKSIYGLTFKYLEEENNGFNS